MLGAGLDHLTFIGRWNVLSHGDRAPAHNLGEGANVAHRPLDEWDIETEIIPYLSGVEGASPSWTAWCPIHDDEGSQHKGLSLNIVGKRNLARCHSPQCGATFKDIVEWRLNGGESNGHEPKVSVRKASARKAKGEVDNPPKKGKGLAWWVEKTQVPLEVWEALGVAQNGTGVVFTFDDPPVAKIRRPPKEIVWSGTDEWNAPPLWPSPEDELPSHITITEGESDCGTARFCEMPEAYAATKGAASEFPPGMFEELRSYGASEVTVVGDMDRAGDEFRSRVTRQALSAGFRVNVVYLEKIVSHFSGVNDLNSLLRYCDGDVEAFRRQIERCTERVEHKYDALTKESIMDLAVKETQWILPGLIAPSDKVLLSGPQKSYKTYIELDLARSLTSCTPFLNRPEWQPSQPANVLLIQEEGSTQAWAKRITRLNLDDAAWSHFHTYHRRGIRFTEPDTIDFVISFCREHEIQVVFFDPLQRMMPGVDENDSSATGIVWDQVMRMQLAIPGLVVGVVHHANKTETLTWESVRGSSRHGGEVDLGLFVQKIDDGVRIGVDGRDIPRYLGTGEAFDAKVHISEDDEKPHLLIDATEISVKVNQVQNLVQKNKDAVINAISDGCTTIASLVSQTGATDTTVRKYIRELVEAGQVEETDNGDGKAKTYTLREGESDEES